MKPAKTKRIFVLIRVAILVSLISAIYFVIQDFAQYSLNKIGFWIVVTRTITNFILLIMSISLWQIVQSYTHKSKWQPHFYNKIRTIGFWSIALTLISPSLQILTYYKQFINNPTSFELKLNAIIHGFLLIFANSSSMWFLSLSIFLFAELLQVANEVKAENESFI
jgi:hypothetical protein